MCYGNGQRLLEGASYYNRSVQSLFLSGIVVSMFFLIIRSWRERKEGDYLCLNIQYSFLYKTHTTLALPCRNKTAQRFSPLSPAVFRSRWIPPAKHIVFLLSHLIFALEPPFIYGMRGGLVGASSQSRFFYETRTAITQGKGVVVYASCNNTIIITI